MILIICIIFCVVIIVIEITHHIERKDLYNRIMCSDIRDYSRIGQERNKNPVNAHERVMKRWRMSEKTKEGDC